SDSQGFLVRVHRDGFEQTMHARMVLLGVPAYAAAPLVAALAPEATAALAAIEYAPVLSIASLYRRAQVRHPLDGFGFLVPRVEHRRILGTLFSSSMFPGRAPQDCVLVTTFAGGKRNPGIAALGDDEVGTVVAEELSMLLGATPRPSWQQVTRWERAIPQYTLGHLDRIAQVESLERATPGLFLCASYRGGVSVGDCIASASALAERMHRTIAASA